MPKDVDINLSEVPRQVKDARILCLDLSSYNSTTRFLLSCLGVFVLYLIYGYMQELIFTLDGFKPFGWFLTLIQFGFYICFSLVEMTIGMRHCCLNLSGIQRRIPIRTYLILAALTLGTMGLSNSSLGYLNYPTQVIFKCCKLIPVLVGSILIQGKVYGVMDYLAALSMCIGLAWFTLADSQLSPNFNPIGVILISLALLCDAAIGNVQEKAMREYNAPSSEVVLYSYGIGFWYLFVILMVTNTLFSGLTFCLQHPYETFGYAFLFSLSGYLGIHFVLALIRTTGALTAATVTTTRKAVTITLSFLLFKKPFTIQYLWSGLVVVLGIYLNILSKKKISLHSLRVKYRSVLHSLGLSNKTLHQKLLVEV